MLELCPHCGTKLSDSSVDSCPQCRKPIQSETGIATGLPDGAGDFASSSLPVHPEEGVPSIVNPATAAPSAPGSLIVILSAILCAVQGAAMSFGRPAGLSLKSEESLIGAIVGIVVGLLIAWDHARFQHQLQHYLPLASDDPDAPLSPPPRNTTPPSEWITIAMVALPILAGGIQWFGADLGLNAVQLALIGSGTILATSVLGYWSIRQLVLHADRTNTYHGAFANPAFVYLGMLGLWIICYPAHFVVRTRMGGRNMLIPALAATAVYLAPMVQPLFTEAELPPADGAEVLTLLKKLIEQEPMMRPVTIRGANEVAFDAAQQKRLAQCKISSKQGEEVVAYRIEWRDRNADIWQVQLLDRLPLVDAPEVLGVLRQILEADPLQREPVVLREPTQLRYDPAKQTRTGNIVVSEGLKERPVIYFIEWENREKTRFRVQIKDRLP